jgi:hypothetical protein
MYGAVLALLVTSMNTQRNRAAKESVHLGDESSTKADATGLVAITETPIISSGCLSISAEPEPRGSLTIRAPNGFHKSIEC